MTARSIEAWLIHKQWSGDTSARAIFFTRELGLVHCLCRGGRTPKKQALLQAFTPLWVAMDARHDRYYAQSLESTSPMLHLVGDSLFSGLYMNELIFNTIKPLSSEPELFDVYVLTLKSLSLIDNRLAMEALLRRFEWSLLRACGQSFSLTHEARTGAQISDSFCYRLVAGEGLVLAANGVPGAHILALAADNLNEVALLKSAKIIMRQAVDHLLGGRDIKARALYK